MKKIVIIIAIVSCALTAQITTKSSDVFEELESGNLTLRFANAVNGKPVCGGIVSVETIGEYTTDEEGKIVFPPPAEDGVLRCSIRAEGYIPTEVPVEIMAGTLFFNRVSISSMIYF